MTSNEGITHYRLLAVELLRTLRGRRSQTAFSKRLGYRSNIVQRWESGHSLPTAATFLACCSKLSLDVAGALDQYYGRRPDWLQQHAADSPQAVAAFLRDQRGKVPLKELAEHVGTNRYTLSRWLSGHAHPRLHEFLAVTEASSHRLLDLLAGLVDPARIPSLAEPWKRLQRAREAAYATPWSHAVLRALELSEARHPSGSTMSWLSSVLGLAPPVLREALLALVDFSPALLVVQRRSQQAKSTARPRPCYTKAICARPASRKTAPCLKRSVALIAVRLVARLAAA